MEGSRLLHMTDQWGGEMLLHERTRGAGSSGSHPPLKSLPVWEGIDILH